MIVLHAIWDNRLSGKLHIWGESSILPLSAPRRRGRRSENQKPRKHPFSLAQGPLKEGIGRLSRGLEFRSAGLGVLTLLLPSTSKGPLPSPELVLEEERGDEKEAVLLPWNVLTLTLDPDLAFKFLLSLPYDPLHGTAFGSSLRFWAEAAKFSLELVVRQCFAPTVEEIQGDKTRSFRASWKVILAEEDARRLRLLSQAMPPISRAFIPPGEKKSFHPLEIVSQFLNQTVDTFIRGNLASTGLIPPHRNSHPKSSSLPEKWLYALTSDDPTLPATAKELKVFSSEIQTWLSQIFPIDSSAPFRTCFRLEEPSEEEEESHDWQVAFHLQAKDDRSLLVPAEEVWKESSSVLTFLKRRFENPQERLLADLGKASRLFPAIEESLKTAHPIRLKLNTEEAYTFLRQSAPLLEESGFGVLLPQWWEKPKESLGVQLRLKSQGDSRVGRGLMGLNSIVTYDWRIAIGDETLSPEEFEKLARLKIPLVKVRGKWVELRPEEIENAIAYFRKRHGEGEILLGDALKIGLGGEGSEVGLRVTGIEGDGWIAEFLDKLSQSAKITEVKTPTTFRGELRPYQERGLSWLSFLKEFGLGACLADDMGLGKTIQMIALMLHDRTGERGRTKPGPTLLVCPMSIVGNWQREVERFGPSLKVMVHHGGERLSGRAFEKEVERHDLVITTYSLVHRDLEHLSPVIWEGVVLDEAQNIKNKAAKQTQAIKRLNANYKIALTGTPVENRLSELWSIMEFLNKGYLGSAKEFRTRFAIPIERFRDRDQAETLKRLLQPFILRRLKTDKTIIKDLPEKMEMKVFTNLTQEQATLYEAVVKEMLERIENSEGIERKGLVLSTLMKLKQICNHPAQFLHDGSQITGRSGKIARLEEMLEEVIALGEKALIFTQFSEMGTMLRSYLQETL